MLENLQNKISFSYMIFLTLKMNLKWDEIKISYELRDESCFKWR